MIENATSDLVKAGSKLGKPFQILTSSHDDTVGFNDNKRADESEHRDYQGDRETEGFAGSIVPTLEERTIYERRPSAVHGNGKPLFDLIESDEAGSGPAEAEVSQQVEPGTQIPEDEEQHGRGVPKVREPPKVKVDDSGKGRDGEGEGEEEERGELYGAPANAHPSDETAPTRGTEREGTKEEDLAAKARKTLRKHLNAKAGNSPWSMPTPTPKIDPNRFHDPLDERFWKDMWVAVAVHNVSDGVGLGWCGG